MTVSTKLERPQDLVPFKYSPFPLGSVKTTGWLQDQLQLCANGLGGHLFDFYDYVAKSTWVGGECEYSELNESAPYWFNAIVPLAWTLDDARLKEQAKQFLDYVLDHQAEDGWLGPETTRRTRGIWARSLLFFGLTQYAEADPTEADRIVAAMHRFVKLAHPMLKNNFEGMIQNLDDDFDRFKIGLMRTHEISQSLQWLYENHPDGNEDVIWEAIHLMFECGRTWKGDWTEFLTEDAFPKGRVVPSKVSTPTHGVNLAEGLRYPTVLYRMNKDSSLTGYAKHALDYINKFHGARSGTIIGDEHLAGLSAQRGSELCTAVELMFSCAYLYRFYGDNEFADQTELAAFNALPAGISPDWWAHQYTTQTNQPWAGRLSESPFGDVGSYANAFGLEPQYPCCTVNHPQGYPKFAASAFARQTDGIVHMLLCPATLTTTVNGGTCKVETQTQYPFSGRLRYTITTEEPFRFSVRIPGWASASSKDIMSSLDGVEQAIVTDENHLANFDITAGSTIFDIDLPLELRVVHRNDTVSIYRGPLLYALRIECTETKQTPLDYRDDSPMADGRIVPGRTHDYDLKPASPWKYAIDPSTAKVEDCLTGDAVLQNPFASIDAVPSVVTVDAYPIEWPEEKGTIVDTPRNPRTDPSTRTRIKLVPFGTTMLHIAEFPVAGRWNA